MSYYLVPAFWWCVGSVIGLSLTHWDWKHIQCSLAGLVGYMVGLAVILWWKEGRLLP